MANKHDKEKKTKELTPEEQAEQERKKKEAQDKAFEELNENNRRKDAQERYNRYKGRNFEAKWQWVTDSSDSIPGQASISSSSGPSLIKPGTYTKKTSRQRPISAQFGYDDKTKLYTLQIDIQKKDGSKWLVPSEVSSDGRVLPRIGKANSPNDYGEHAEITAKQAVKFMARVGFSEIEISFPEDNPFRPKGFKEDSMQYAKIYVATALDEALKAGMSVNAKALESFLAALENQGEPKIMQEYQVKIERVNNNAEKVRLYNELVSPKTLAAHYEKLNTTKPFDKAAITTFNNEVQKVIDEKKVTEDESRLLKDLQEKAKAKGVESNLDLQKLRDSFEAIKNPDQKLKDACKILKDAVEGVKNKEDYINKENTLNPVDHLEAFRSRLNELEERLKSSLNNKGRENVNGELKILIEKMGEFASKSTLFKQECGNVIDKAKEVQEGGSKQQEQQAIKEIENRMKNLEAAANSLAEVYNKKQSFDRDPSKLVGMIIGKKGIGDRLPFTTRFYTIDDDKEAEEYLNKGFNELNNSRDDLQRKIEAEKESLQKEISKLPSADQNKWMDRLAKVNTPPSGTTPSDSPTPGSPGSSGG